MLDPRLYRSAFLPLAIAVVVVAFALHGPPPPLGTTLAADAFDGARAQRTLSALETSAPDRRPGSPGDEALAGQVAAAFARQRGFAVRQRTFAARTIDGRRTLRTVLAERPGVTNRRIVVLAHRDAAEPGTRGGLAATAGLLELAHVLGGTVTTHTLTLVSTSGGSGGAAGAADFAGQGGAPVDAAIVLGDLGAGRPRVVGWSESRGQAPPRLQVTARAAVRQETGQGGGPPAGTAQFLHLAFPAALGEQGPLEAAGLPAVLIGSADEREATGAGGDAGALRAAGRAALRTVSALDAAPPASATSASSLVLGSHVLPAWTVRLLVAALLAPALLGALDAFFRVRRRHGAPVRWLAWPLTAAVPFVLAALWLVVLRVVGVLGAAAPAPVPPGTVPVAPAGVVLALAALAAGWLLARPAVTRVLGLPGGPHGLDGPAPGVAVALVTALVAAAVWLRNPFAAAFLVPAAHAWLLVGVRRRRPGSALALVLAGLVPLALAALGAALALHAGPLQLGWIGLLALAGGHVGVLGVLTGSLLAGCAASALGLAVRARAASVLAPRPAAVPARRPAGPLADAGAAPSSAARR